MLVLGLETSCDDTAAAVLQDGKKLLSNIINDQTRVHSRFGGIVPELAGRSHVDQVQKVIRQSLESAQVELSQIDLIAVTVGPGLIGSLLVGVNAAKGISYGLGIPLVGVNHLEGHLLAIFLQNQIEFPFISLVVSGGHTDLYRVDNFGQYKNLGRTRDDAAGESFDKVAKMLGQKYPGGPIIEKLAKDGDPGSHQFPRAYLEKGSLDFSFSGLKTSVKTYINKKQNENGGNSTINDIAAGFQEAVVEVLSKKIITACVKEGLNRVVVTGGVAANGALRKAVASECEKAGFKSWFPDPVFCTDNAAMIACAGYHKFKSSPESEADLLDLDATASLYLD
ncbi:MAG: tRNA (adenosine(37)-N6)-threonylcarbamoyltransferase complex transferase subunit TsaD [Nitrospinae bacterium]|nr:tRNA (adenosine(37)-N6)-threonylcarbamoyltransferase complex transferase subunit TsaD [Nitrospinota bacterium]MZH15537.1 tRNA (adenosine(37)-N6)-threonylcarbamoyltransferase complex transferase subunit TsaD [Nitrospinota bacterium]